MNNLKMYTGYAKESEEDGACLIFAIDARFAKKMAFNVIKGWFDDIHWPDVAVKWIKSNPYYLRMQAIEKGPHVIESPNSCRSCLQWGTGEIVDGECDECRATE